MPAGNQTTPRYWYRIEYILVGLTLLLLYHNAFTTYIVKNDTIIYRKIYSSIIVADLPWVMIFDILIYIAFIVFAHIIIAVAAYLVSRVLQRYFGFRNDQADALGLLSFISIWSGIYLENSLEFPRSEFAYPDFNILNIITPETLLVFFLVLSGLAVLVLITGGMLLLKQRLSGAGTRPLVIAVTTATALIVVLGVTRADFAVVSGTGKEQPNVIIIGVDSLMLEYLTDTEKRHLLPFITNYLKDTVSFNNAFTSQARTFPSWMTILSGKYPKNNDARINLVDTSNIDTTGHLQNALERHGYTSLYAIDEVRFSNLDTRFGFDTLLTPKIGAADFVIGAMGDIPVANILRNTSLARILLPYHYINRAMNVAYDPRSYSTELGKVLNDIRKRPVFIATHFCMTHWPYFWRKKIKREKGFVFGDHTGNFLPVYEGALQEVDNQVREFLTDLETRGYLDNAIVVLLSDHGEAIGRDDDFPFSLPETDTSSLDRQLYGHGTNIFAATQYRILLAFKRYGPTAYEPGQSSQLVSSIDIYPTLQELLSFDSTDELDGISLAAWVLDTGLPPVEREVFLETGFYLPALNKINPSTRDLMAQGIGYYNVNAEGRLVVNESMIDSIMFEKQLGIRNSNSILGTYTVSRDQVNLYFASYADRSIIQLTRENLEEACAGECRILLAGFIEFYGEEARQRLQLSVGNEMTDRILAGTPGL